MRITRPMSAFLVAMTIIAAAPGVARSQAAAGTPAPAPVPHAAATAYSSDSSAFVRGRTVYLRSTKTRIGTIEAVDADHAFPSRFARRRMSAVLIRRKDGPRDWVPVEGITRIYVVGR